MVISLIKKFLLYLVKAFLQLRMVDLHPLVLQGLATSLVVGKNLSKKKVVLVLSENLGESYICCCLVLDRVEVCFL